VVVRADLPRGIQAAQIIHASGESAVLTNYLPPGTNAVALQVHDEAALVKLGRALDAANIPFVKIRENDDPYRDQLMAVGIAPILRTPKLKRIFGGVKLLT